MENRAKVPTNLPSNINNYILIELSSNNAEYQDQPHQDELRAKVLLVLGERRFLEGHRADALTIDRVVL